MEKQSTIPERLANYRTTRLDPDLTGLSEREHQMLPLLIKAAEAMEGPFWVQNYGDPAPLLDGIADSDFKRFIRMNYGPWDRQHQDEPILPGVESKPPGANFFPPDINQPEFEAAARLDPELKSPFTMVQRNAQGQLVAIPYHEFFREHVSSAAEFLRQAAALAESAKMQRFLRLRADALLTDDYRASDFAWMDLTENTLELLIGPMEISDRLFGIKTAYAASILRTDWPATKRLRRYTAMLPQLQESLPVPAHYKREPPGLKSDLRVVDVIRFAGLDGLETPTGVAWPNDEQVQLEKGLRFLLLGNVLRAKYEALLAPLADLLIDDEQRRYAGYEGNFNFVMFHELAHGLGVKHTLANRTPVREALQELHHPVEEGKADLISLHLAMQLHDRGHLSKSQLQSVFVSSLVRLLYNYDGVQSIVRLNYFKKAGAYSRDPGTGTYQVHPEHMPAATETLARQLLQIQANGDHDGAGAFLARYGRPDQDLANDIQTMKSANLPAGIIFLC